MKKAFTLTEVLVTLSIIGLVAALTVPVVISSTHKTVNAEGCKKAFVVLSDAMEIARMEQPFEQWSMTDADTTANYNRIKRHLNIIKECVNKAGCWTPSVSNLNKSGAATNFAPEGYGTPAISFKTADGMNVAFDVHGESFNVNRKSTQSILFAVDVNSNNPPNRLGDDVFVFVLGDNGLVPAGIDAIGNGDCTRAGAGRDCAARVIREGAINY